MKGLVMDVLTVIIIVMTVGLTAIIMMFVLGEFKTTAAASGVLNTTYIEQGETAMLVFNYGLMFLMFGGVIVAILLAFMVKTHPAFMVVSLLILIALIPVSAVLTNTFREIASTATLASTSNQFNILLEIVNSFPLILTVAGFIVVIVLYGKLKNTDVSA